MTQHQEFPKQMTHPNYWPGYIGEEVTDAYGFKSHKNGLPARFPPVVVHTANQQAEYEAKGYVASASSPGAFAQAMAGTVDGYQPMEYPKWVGDVLVQDAEQEATLAAGGSVKVKGDIKIVAAPEPESEVDRLKRELAQEREERAALEAMLESATDPDAAATTKGRVGRPRKAEVAAA